MATFFRPTSLGQALHALAAAPRTIVAGGTDHYPARVIHEPPEELLDITAVPGLRDITHRAGAWTIPALATWTDLIRTPLPPLFDGLRHAARQVGGMQIQNAGTLVGNVCNASPAADGIPALLALDAAVELQSVAGRRILPLQDFIRGPRQTARRAEELVTALHIPCRPGRSSFHKLGGRRYLIISITMAALTLEQAPDGVITRAAIAVGACGPRAVRLIELEAALIGHRPDPALVQPDHLAPLTPIDDFRATAAYRRTATVELLRRGLLGFADQAQAA